MSGNERVASLRHALRLRIESCERTRDACDRRSDGNGSLASEARANAYRVALLEIDSVFGKEGP